MSYVDKWHDLGDPFLFVTGYYLSVSTTSAVAAEPFMEPLNQSVLFLKDKDIVLSSDAWHVALGLNVSTFEDVLSTIKSHLSVILLKKQDFAPISKLRQVETLLDNIETRIYEFKQLFPKTETRRSLMNFGGTVLRALFGTATVRDLHRLHEALGKLRDKNSEVVHSKQVTYIRNLNYVTNLNTEALVNLSTIVKDNVVQPHGRFQDVSKDIAWLNDTLCDQSELYLHEATRVLIDVSGTTDW